MNFSTRLIVLLCTLLSGSYNAHAAVIEYLPESNGTQVASNQASSSNIWTAINQSFTAADTNILFGFYFENIIGGPEAITYTLRNGDGNSGNILATELTTITITNSNAQLFEVDFSSVNLVVGQKYTIGVSLTNGQPSSGQHSNSKVINAGSSVSNPNPYVDGQFYYSGSPYDNSFPQRDLAFRMSGVSVSEPATLSFFIISLLGFGAARKLKSGLKI